MPMEETLEHDNAVSWIHDGINLSKRPLVDSLIANDYEFPTDASHFSPITIAEGIIASVKHHPVTYMMCQATGYKLTSNKELPSNYQHFSMTIPLTSEGASGDKPDTNQKYPMFTITNMSGDNYTVKLVRIRNILSSGQTFTQQDYGTEIPYFEYAENTATTQSGKTSRQCE